MGRIADLLSRAETLAAAVLLAASSMAGATNRPSVVECSMVPAGSPPAIDGVLDDVAWQGAVWYERFTQSVPTLGEPATEKTRVAFLHDDESIYAAVRCDDGSPSLIRANKLRHRDDPQSDDHIQLIFDTYRDQTRGVVFIVNPLGAKEEGLVLGYHQYNWSWEEVWEAATAVTGRGWQAEIRLPLRLFRYREAEQQEWGVNVRRSIMRKHEDVYLAAPPPPFDISSLNYTATLTGLRLGARQRNLQVVPYLLAGATRGVDASSGKDETSGIEELGLDVKYSLTSDLTIDATYNTDFSQVESDDEQVNLTRFSLFFPEKREFFLENAQLFSFGPGEGGPQGPAVVPFFSRRIGLFEGETVPIELGIRLTGKAGRQDIGLISVRTGAATDLDLSSGLHNAVRLRRDLGGRSYVGGIFTDSRRGGSRSTTLGVDAGWFITEPLSLRGYFLTVDDDEAAESADAYHVSLDLTTDPWGFLFTFEDVDEGFDPALGYVQRVGYRKEEGIVRRSFRPGRWGVRRFSIRPFARWLTATEEDRLESSTLRLNLEVELERGDVLEVSCNRNFERLFEPFDLGDELSLSAGDYTFSDTEIEYQTDPSKRFGGAAALTAGRFYDGNQRLLSGELWYVLSRHFRVSGGSSTYDVETDHGDLDWQLWSFRLDYVHSSSISASSFLQHNSSTGATVLNLRFHWILRNDSDLYLVFNNRQAEDDALADERGRDFAAKINFRFFL